MTSTQRKSSEPSDSRPARPASSDARGCDRSSSEREIRETRFGQEEWRLVYGVALKILKAPDQAEDAAQEAMLRAYRGRQSFAGAARFESWLYRIAFTTALSFLRKPQYRRYSAPAPGSDWDSELAQIAAPGQSPEDRVNASQLVEYLEGCLRGMRELDRLAFVERFVRGTSERELGEMLGVSTNAAKQRAFRARQAVRRCMLARDLGALNCLPEP